MIWPDDIVPLPALIELFWELIWPVDIVPVVVIVPLPRFMLPFAVVIDPPAVFIPFPCVLIAEALPAMGNTKLLTFINPAVTTPAVIVYGVFITPAFNVP